MAGRAGPAAIGLMRPVVAGMTRPGGTRPVAGQAIVTVRPGWTATAPAGPVGRAGPTGRAGARVMAGPAGPAGIAMMGPAVAGMTGLNEARPAAGRPTVTVPLGRTAMAPAGPVGRAGLTDRTGPRVIAGRAIVRPGRAVIVTAGPVGRASMTGRLVTVRAGRTAGGAATTAGPGRARRAGAGRGLVTPGPTGLAAGPVRAGTGLGPVAGRVSPGAAGLAARRPGRAARDPVARLARPGRFLTYLRASLRTSSTRRPGRSCGHCPATWPRRWPGS